MKKSGRGVELFPVWGDYGSSHHRIWNLSHEAFAKKREIQRMHSGIDSCHLLSSIYYVSCVQDDVTGVPREDRS